MCILGLSSCVLVVRDTGTAEIQTFKLETATGFWTQSCHDLILQYVQRATRSVDSNVRIRGMK